MNVLLYHLLRNTLYVWLRWFYRVRVYGDLPGKGQPLVVISNHVNFWDPFLITFALRRPLSFVAADGNFRSRKMRFLMNLAGQVPKAKGRTDMQSIRQLHTLVQHGQGIAIFPEGQRTWDGEPRPLLPGVEKLIRLLRAPVLAVQIRGAYRSLPRWSSRGRRGKIEIHMMALTAAQSRDPVTIAGSIHFSEDQWQEQQHVRFVGPHRAQGLENVLFFCPQCDAWGSLQSEGAEIRCTRCGTIRILTGRGFFNSGPFTTVAAWHRYQMGHLRHDLSQPEPRSLPLRYTNVHMFRGFRMRPPSVLGVGSATLRISRDALILEGQSPAGGAFSLALPVQELTGITVQYTRQLELYFRGKLYILSLRGPRDSAYRVEQSLLILQELYRNTVF